MNAVTAPVSKQKTSLRQRWVIGLLCIVSALLLLALGLYWWQDGKYVYGQVRDTDTGLPLRGASVWLGSRQTNTDATGSYRFDQVQGVVTITVQAPGYQPGLVVVDTRPLFRRGFPAEVALSPNRVQGTVRDALTRLPVPGVEIIVRDQRATSDGEGHYILQRVQPGERLLVRRRGYRPVQVSLTTPDHLSGAQPLDILLPPTVLTGTVRDGLDGRPVAGAKVRVEEQETNSDEEGHYRLLRVALGTTLTVEAPGYLPLVIGPIEPAHLDGQPLNAVLVPNTLTGTVRDGLDGRPVGGAEVRAGEQETSTDERGHYALRRVAAGITLTVAAPGYVTQVVGPVEPAHLNSQPLDVTLMPNVLTGTVCRADNGYPIAGATITLGERTVHSDETGRFTLRRVRAGDTVEVEASGYQRRTVIVQTLEPLTIALVPARRVTVTVRHLIGGEPLPGATVQVGETVVSTDERGRATLLAPAPGTPIRAEAPGFMPEQVVYQGEEIIELALRPYQLGTVMLRDAHSGAPVTQGRVYLGDQVLDIPADGLVAIPLDLPPQTPLTVLAPGYRATEVPLAQALNADLPLEPFQVRGIYIPFGLLYLPDRVRALIDLVERTELNAIVVDMKGDRGYLGYPSQIALAKEIGAVTKVALDVKELLRTCREKGIYTIARIVVFKDNPLAHGRTDLAVKHGDGTIWLDLERLGWGNPYREEVWEYNIAIAKEVAALGFDEVQFDYIRFPSDGDLTAIVYEEENTPETREAAIRTFMERLQAALRPFKVFTSADVFGLTLWVYTEMGIGQRVENIAPFVDFLCPMVYPSTFITGNLGYDNPALYPYEVVYRSSLQAMKRTDTKIRPWLQHYSLYGVTYGLEELQAQKQAAIDAGTCGWTFWNAGGRYKEELFAKREEE